METETFGQLPAMPEGRCCAATGVIDSSLYYRVIVTKPWKLILHQTTVIINA